MVPSGSQFVDPEPGGYIESVWGESSTSGLDFDYTYDIYTDLSAKPRFTSKVNGLAPETLQFYSDGSLVGTVTTPVPTTAGSVAEVDFRATPSPSTISDIWIIPAVVTFR